MKEYPLCSTKDPAYSNEPGHIIVILSGVEHVMSVEEAVEHVKWCIRAIFDAENSKEEN